MKYVVAFSTGVRLKEYNPVHYSQPLRLISWTNYDQTWLNNSEIMGMSNLLLVDSRSLPKIGAVDGYNNG